MKTYYNQNDVCTSIIKLDKIGTIPSYVITLPFMPMCKKKRNIIVIFLDFKVRRYKKSFNGMQVLLMFKNHY